MIPRGQGDRVGEDVLIKKMRGKISKIRKLQESFVIGDFEGDLLLYALEKDVGMIEKKLKEENFSMLQASELGLGGASDLVRLFF